MEPPMTVRELSDYLRLDRMTIYKMLKDGSIPASRIGHQWRFFRSDIDEWIRSLRTGQRASALVVDEDANVRQLFDEELSTDKFEVFSVATGKEALAMASQRRFDLIVLELKRATIATFRQIRSNDENVPVVVVANSSEGRLVDQAMEVGIFTLMRRPTSGAEIRTVLQSLALRPSPTV